MQDHTTLHLCWEPSAAVQAPCGLVVGSVQYGCAIMLMSVQLHDCPYSHLSLHLQSIKVVSASVSAPGHVGDEFIVSSDWCVLGVSWRGRWQLVACAPMSGANFLQAHYSRQGQATELIVRHNTPDRIQLSPGVLLGGILKTMTALFKRGKPNNAGYCSVKSGIIQNTHSTPAIVSLYCAHVAVVWVDTIHCLLEYLKWNQCCNLAILSIAINEYRTTTWTNWAIRI